MGAIHRILGRLTHAETLFPSHRGVASEFSIGGHFNLSNLSPGLTVNLLLALIIIVNFLYILFFSVDME